MLLLREIGEAEIRLPSRLRIGPIRIKLGPVLHVDAFVATPFGMLSSEEVSVADYLALKVGCESGIIFSQVCVAKKKNQRRAR